MMKLTEAQSLIDRLAAEWGMSPVKVRINRRFTATGGRAYLKRRVIEVAPWMLGSGEADDTLRHELAHFLASDLGMGSYHGQGWRKAAIVLGASPTQCYALGIRPPAREYRYQCPGCRRIKRSRSPSLEGQQIACGRCCNEAGIWDVRFVFKRLT